MTPQQKKTAVAVGRRFGASPEAREKMRQADAEAAWSGVCRHCNTPLRGRIADLLSHRCADGAEKSR